MLPYHPPTYIDTAVPGRVPRTTRVATPNAGIEFSIAHTADKVVVAVADNGPVGVDLERIRDGLALDDLARSMLSEAEAPVFAGAEPRERVRAFLTYWTRKEAVLKATGQGLTVPLPAIEVSPPRDAPRLVRASGLLAPDGAVQIVDVAAGEDYVAAAAVVLTRSGAAVAQERAKA